MPPGGSASVEPPITTNAALADRSVYGRYLVVSEVGGSTFAVPYAGFKGDYQSIDAVSGETLSRRTGSGTFVDLPAGGTFTLVGASEVPYVRLHFAHPARRLEIQILDAASGKPVHPVFSNALEQDYLGRAAAVGALSAFAWNGTRLHDNGAGNGDHLKEVRDGRYKLVVKVLKALGDPTDATHWETWTSPTITIDRP